MFGKLICGDAEPTPEQEEKNLLSSPEGEDKVSIRVCHYHKNYIKKQPQIVC